MKRFEAQLTALLPEGWFAKESITLLAPDGQGNVIASSEPLDPSIDTVRYATIQGDLLRKEFPAYIETSFVEAKLFGGLDGYRRHFEWTPPDGVRVTQLQVYLALEGRGYTATATCVATQGSRFEATFATLLDSLAFRTQPQPQPQPGPMAWPPPPAPDTW